MANCTAITGLSGRCERDNSGGVLVAYIGVIPETATMADYQEYVTEATGTISAFDGTAGAAPLSVTLYKYDFTKDSATFVETPTHTNYGVGYDQVFTMDFSKMSVDVRNEIQLLSYHKRLIVAMVNANGECQVMGVTTGGMVSGGLGQTGANIGEENKYQVVITAKEAVPAFFTTVSAITAAV